MDGELLLKAIFGFLLNNQNNKVKKLVKFRLENVIFHIYTPFIDIAINKEESNYPDFDFNKTGGVIFLLGIKKKWGIKDICTFELIPRSNNIIITSCNNVKTEIVILNDKLEYEIKRDAINSVNGWLCQVLTED